MKELPEKYLQEMQNLLSEEEFQKYLASFEVPAFHGLRVNTNKISVEEFREKFPYDLKPVPWCRDGFYYNEADPVSKHPYYFAGLYYIQEPSAMLPAEVLPIEAGDKVLDVCAAPGGKSTKLGAKLKGTGVLFSNDISASRCQGLLKNLERFGIRNSFVMSEDPQKFAPRFEGYFDKILVDAPCSGEGMFRKEPHLIDSWKEKDSSFYAPIQKSIMKSCLSMLKEGGMLVYSTCTFARCEDEEVIQYALSLDSELKVIPIPVCDGFVQNEYGTKLFPHRIAGEGHFVCLLQKGEKKQKAAEKETVSAFRQDHVSLALKNGSFETIQDKKYFVPETGNDLKGLRIMRSGLLLGEEKKNRFVFSGALALAMKAEDCDNVMDLPLTDERVVRYLKGETLKVDDYKLKDGYALVCVDHYPLGFARISHGLFKNQYPKAWIYQ